MSDLALVKESIWEKFIERLKTVTQQRFISDRSGKSDQKNFGLALVSFSIFLIDGQLMGWTRPYRTQLEPITDVNIKSIPSMEKIIGGWVRVHCDIVENSAGATGHKTFILVVSNSTNNPVGWYVGPELTARQPIDAMRMI